MSSPFPQLLRRANIATYDPLITRIYTSTPSSKSQHADWGLKFPIHLPKGPRYIKFSSLDAGPGFNCDWRSAEREARFMSAWGNGSVRWQHEDETTPKYQKKTRPLGGHGYLIRDEDMVEEEHGQEVWMRDVESMSEDDFEAYLERIRSERKRFLNESLQGMAESNRATLRMPEDETLVHLATASKASEGATATFQARLTADDLVDPTSTKINSRPHRVHGLTYGRAPHSSTDFNPISEKKGRALNKVNRSDDAYSRATDAFSPRSRSSVGSKNNLPWVVGLGGVTAKAQPGGSGKLNDPSSSSSAWTNIDETDYTRVEPARGAGRFRVSVAQIARPPTVLALSESRAGGQFGGKWRQSAAALPSPMDTFRFDIDLSLASASEAVESDEASSPSLSVGSRPWVARERRASSIDQYSAERSMGQPRRDRVRGEAAERLRAAEATAQSRSRVDNILAKLKAKRLADAK